MSRFYPRCGVWFLAGLALALSVGRLRAQRQEELLVPVAPGPVALGTVEEIRYHSTYQDERGFNRTVEAPATPPTLTLYHPRPDRDRGLAIVICPGGGYQRLFIDYEGHAIARWLQSEGITGAVLKYRVPQAGTPGQTLPTSQQDALAALRLLRSDRPARNAPYRRVGIVGFSAGGHLAGSTAVFGRAADGSRPDFVALVYPVVSMTEPYAHRGSQLALLGPQSTPERQREFSLELQARPEHPPHLLLHASDDKTVPVQNSELLAAALRRAGVAAQLHLYPSGGHGFRSGESTRWREIFLQWLKPL
jgi:acetyl esterase/lipase